MQKKRLFFNELLTFCHVFKNCLSFHGVKFIYNLDAMAIPPHIADIINS